MVAQRLDRGAGGDLAVERKLQRAARLGRHHGAGQGRREVAADDIEAGAPLLARTRRLSGGLGGLILRQAHDIEGPRPVRQALDEAALLEARDQAVDAGLGLEPQGFLHLVEGRGNAGFAQLFLDEFQEFPLLAR